LQLGRTIAKLSVATMSKGGGSDPIRCVRREIHAALNPASSLNLLALQRSNLCLRFSKGLQKAGLPSLDDLKKIIK